MLVSSTFLGRNSDIYEDMNPPNISSQTKTNQKILAILGFITAIVITITGANPVHAATKISSIPLTTAYSTVGTTVFYGKSFQIGASWKGYSYRPGQKATLELQRKIGSGKWTKAASKVVKLPFSSSSSKFNLKPITSSKSSVKISYRVVSRANSYVSKTTVSKPTTITFKYKYPNGFPLASVYYNNVPGNSIAHPNNVSAKLSFATSKYSYYKGDKVVLTLQRKIGSGKWGKVTSKTLALPLKTSDSTFTAPAYKTSKASETVYYKVTSAKTKTVDKTSTSKTLTLKYINQSKYTGQVAAYYNTVKTYCPTALISIGSNLKSSSGKDAAGLYRSGTHQIQIDTDVAGYPETHRRTVLLHECAHLKQDRLYGTSADKVMAKYFVNDVKPVSNFDAHEHAADCAALAIEPKGYLGYGGHCNSSELVNGKKLILGQKF